MNLTIRNAQRREFEFLLLQHHYAKRIPSISFAFGLYLDDLIVGVVTFGLPASRQIQTGMCPTNPDAVIELNRLCILPVCPKNTASWLISRALAMLPALIVVSYADTVQGHAGWVYRAANFKYAGWTDMDRKTPRYDYIVLGKHSRQAFRDGVAQYSEKVRRLPKIKYWTISGNKRERRALEKIAKWPALSWEKFPAPFSHQKIDATVNSVIPLKHDEN
jgi:hypothetical protein